MAGKASWCQLPCGGAIISSATNTWGDRVATGCQTATGSEVQIWEPSASGPSREWSLRSQVAVQEPVTSLAWAHPESGLLVAGATATGAVYVLEAPRPAVVPDDAATQQEPLQQQEWRLASSLQASSSGVRHLSFAPCQYGLLLCAACADGLVMLWEADRPLAPNTWSLQAKFKVLAQPGTGNSRGGTGCTGLSWRRFSPGAAPLLAVSTPHSVEVWQYGSQLMQWQRVSSLQPSSPHEACSWVDWAPTMGRPVDLLAAAHGATVDIWSLQGDTASAQGLVSERVAQLAHDSPVTKVEFNMLGTCLAASTQSNCVYMWKPDLLGNWLLMGAVQGSSKVAAAEEEEPDGMLVSQVD